MSGQLDIRDSGRPVLRYNYRPIEPGDVLDKVAPANRIYARPRSDYIHPLYGPDGEELTKDWSLDHPHHRGIYWAWPEVDYHNERGDLHALQRVFARPTGRFVLQSGAVYAEIQAEKRKPAPTSGGLTMPPCLPFCRTRHDTNAHVVHEK